MKSVLLRIFILTFATFGTSMFANADFPLAYVGYPDARDMALSPDGTSVAILMTDFEFGIRQRRDWDVIEFKSAETGDVSYKHDLDDRLYYWVSWPFEDVLLAQTLTYKFSRRKTRTQLKILAINPETGDEKVLYSGPRRDWRKDREVPKISGISLDRREIAIETKTAGGVELRAINVDSGNSRLLAKGNSRTLRWEFGDDFVPTLRFDRGRRGNDELVYSRTKSGKWVLRQSYNVLENSFRPAGRLTKEQTMLVVHRPDGAERAALYSYDFNTNSYAEKVYENPDYDLASARRASYGSELLYVGWFEDRLERKWFNRDYEAAGKQLEAALKPEDNWSILETSKDGQNWLIYVSSPQRPGAYMHFDRAAKRLRVLANGRPDLTRDKLSAIQRIDYTAQDGTPLFGYLTPAKTGNNAPLVVMPHGGPVARDHADFDGYAQFLAFKGYNVFQPQFRGGGGLGKTFEEAGFGEWGRAMQTDIEDGVAALIEQNLIYDTTPRSIMGFSYGGYAAMAGATLTPDAYQCAISINGVSDLPMMLNSYDRNDAYENDIYNIWVSRIGDPETDMTRILDVSPSSHVASLKAQVLLVHGTVDDIVDANQSRQMYQTILDANKYAIYHEVEGAGHHLYSQDDRTNVLVMVDRFLAQCMPTR